MPNALFKRFNGTVFEEFKFPSFDSEKLGGVLPSGYALASHTHSISDVLTLQTELDGKLSSDAGDVTNTNLADMAAGRVKGRAVGSGTGAPVDLTAAQLTAIVNEATTTVPGKVLLSEANSLQSDDPFVITEAVLQNYVGTASDKIAVGNHGHGNISSAGGWSNTPQTVASGDTFVITKSGLLNNSSLAFGTATDTFLRNDGTWAEAGGAGGGAVTYSARLTSDLTTGTNTNGVNVFEITGIVPGEYLLTIHGRWFRPAGNARAWQGTLRPNNSNDVLLDAFVEFVGLNDPLITRVAQLSGQPSSVPFSGGNFWATSVNGTASLSAGSGLFVLGRLSIGGTTNKTLFFDFRQSAAGGTDTVSIIAGTSIELIKVG